MKTTPRQITYSSGIGRGAYILGGIALFLGGCLIYSGIYAGGIAFVLPGIFLIGFRIKSVLDKDTQMFTKKTGLFVPTILRINRSMMGITAVLLTRYPVRYDFITNVKAGSTYTLELEHPDGNIPIDYFDDHQKGYDTGHKIAKWLDVKFLQNVEK